MQWFIPFGNTNSSVILIIQKSMHSSEVANVIYRQATPVFMILYNKGGDQWIKDNI